MVNVICMKWGTCYGPEYVNHLRSMVRRHLNLAHRFVCFTDDRRGLAPDIEVQPLPKVVSRPGRERFWNKLGIFSSPLLDLTGPVLCLDLDVVIVDCIDCLFEAKGEFIMVKEYRTKPGTSPGNTSVCRFEAGAHPDILARFEADPEAVEARYTFDQDLVADMAKNLSFWPQAWCPSFKRHCIPDWPLCYFTPPRLPAGARIAVFHGQPKPAAAAHGCFVRGGIKYCRATPWVSENWR